MSLIILLPHEAREWKKIRQWMGGILIEWVWRRGYYRLGSTTRIIPGRRTATLPLSRLRAATVVL